MCIIYCNSSQPPHSNKIIVHTRLRREIENIQDDKSLTLWEQHNFAELKIKHQYKYLRNGPTTIYNCHGLVFASRRTRVHDTAELQKILQDDNYKEIDQKNILPGDVILYINEMGGFEHSGIVLEVTNEPRVPIICSKWGNNGPEVVHSAYICPYDKCNIKFYRIIDNNV